MYYSLLGVFFILVKALATENTENNTTPKICKITVLKTTGINVQEMRERSCRPGHVRA